MAKINNINLGSNSYRAERELIEQKLNEVAGIINDNVAIRDNSPFPAEPITQQQPIDMNSQEMLNLPYPDTALEPVRKTDLPELIDDLVVGARRFNDVSEIEGVDFDDGDYVILQGWHPGSDVGGGMFYYDAFIAKSQHDGGRYFSPTVPWTVTTSDYLNKVGETDPAGTGCLVRKYRSNAPVLSTDYGSTGGNADTDTQALINGTLQSTALKTWYVFVNEGVNYIIKNTQLEYDDVWLLTEPGVRLQDVDVGGSMLKIGNYDRTVDYRIDNLPIFKRLSYWDEAQYSPATGPRPRYSNAKILCDFRISFYKDIVVELGRLNTATAVGDIEFIGNPTIFGTFTALFCRDVILHNTTNDNTEMTLGVTGYWCYNILMSGNVSGKPADGRGFEFKGCTNGLITQVEAKNMFNGVSIGYGSKNCKLSFADLSGCARAISIKASEEFDYSSNVEVEHVTIDESCAVGYFLSGVKNITVDHSRNYAQVSYRVEKIPFTTGSDLIPAEGFTPVLNSDRYVFDGNYDDSNTILGHTRYSEYRPWPVISGAKFSNCVDRPSTDQNWFRFFSDATTGYTEVSGLIKRFTSIAESGLFEDRRTENLAAGVIELDDESYPNEISGVVFDKSCNVRLQGSGSKLIAADLGVIRNSDFGVRSLEGGLTGQWAQIFLADTVTFSGEFKHESISSPQMNVGNPTNVKFTGVFYNYARLAQFTKNTEDAFTEIVIDCDIKYRHYASQVTIPANPAFITNYASVPDADATWSGTPLNCTRMSITNTGGGIDMRTVLRHTGSVPTGYSSTCGGVLWRPITIDGVSYTCRVYSALNTSTPSITPNFQGEIAENVGAGFENTRYVSASGAYGNAETVKWYRTDNLV